MLPPLLVPKRGLPSVAGRVGEGFNLAARLDPLPASPCTQGEGQKQGSQLLTLLLILLLLLLLTLGPLCVGEGRTTRPAGASTWMSMPFRQGRKPCRKARPNLTYPKGDSPGCSFFWLLFFEQAKKSDSDPGRGSKARRRRTT
ncbi:hypothetical protein DVJ77_20750 [Dyella tabacisoli]|uniref:Uncharacterized protein n=1 Tax=Dyella tabacisoli TaxID=2282381 RepID=A0A369UJJ9_9GAMM|nr:hypothetical protein DVJ77_20750 [Dyella tabacisoli]